LIRHFLLVAGTLACGAVFANCHSPQAPWVTLEVVAGEAATNDAAEFVEITQSGCVTTRYAAFDTRAGTYQYELTPAEIASLHSTIASAPQATLDAHALRARIVANDAAANATRVARGEARTLWTVSDGDSYRIDIAEGPQHNLIAWYAPKQEAAHRRDVAELDTLVAFIEAVQHIGASERKAKVAEVTP